MNIIYCKYPPIKREEIFPLLELSEIYDIRVASIYLESCIEIILCHKFKRPEKNKEDAFHAFHLSDRFRLDRLKDKIIKWFCKYWQEFWRNENFALGL